ncbi:MAG TPA: YlxR family protein [Actinomycetota bacterium]|nr:YlxR family protein [Actinomycetota bacterium]
MAPRRQPERTCVGCRRRAAKSELLRVVRRIDGEVSVDPSATAPGRGAYVHPGEECIRTALRTQSIARALRTQIPADRTGSLIEEVIKARESARADP